ncbi:RCC1 domain-containing protein, partial [Brevibacillus sp. MCWH]|uniref:RCC1 domain-containing protein n=1 Tax=Brevibacillus sp. MCWH TaxID=2508871 RepID=UPI00352FF5A2|nr:RCC1 repeat-containing protein [Brevibacillus sp. MCWH]
MWGKPYYFLLLNDGTVSGCGRNADGQLTGVSESIKSVTDLGITGVKSVSCGFKHTVFLLNDGTVRCCGNNEYGQFGNGTTSAQNRLLVIPNLSKVFKVICGSYFTFFLFSDGSIKSCGYNYYG